MKPRNHIPSAWSAHELAAFRDGMRLRAQLFEDRKKKQNHDACRKNRGRKKGHVEAPE